MKIAVLLASVMLAATVLPALAQEYYIVQGPDRHCRIVDQRPVTKEMTIVGPSGVTYKTRTEAMDAMKTVTVCE